MKRLIISLVIILATFQVFGQKKSKVDPKDSQIDSLTKVTKTLTLKNDSLSGELLKYLGVYNAIKEKVLHRDFDPTRSAFLIDSLQASRDSATALLLNPPKSSASADEISILTQENTKLKAEIDSMKASAEKGMQLVSDPELEKAAVISSLKQLKDLLDSKIITDLEFVTLKKKYVNKL